MADRRDYAQGLGRETGLMVRLDGNIAHRLPENSNAHPMALDALEALLDDRMMPVQWYDRMRPSPDAGELKLGWAILESALRDLKRGPSLTNPKARRSIDYRTAVAYFTDIESTDVFSLRTVCEALNVDPFRVAKRALAIAEQHHRTGQPLKREPRPPAGRNLKMTIVRKRSRAKGAQR